MQTFSFHNPVRLVFGVGTIAQLADLVPADARPFLLFGGGSIKANGVYAQVQAALGKRLVGEFAGIEPNPQFTTCMRAVAAIRAARGDFLLAVGGGSVVDAVKFIAAASCTDGDPWRILETFGAEVRSALPLAAVLTLPATGSEMNANSVISRAEIGQKRYFSSPAVYPRFAILDPQTTCSLPPRQVGNGIVDTFVHVCEQYLGHREAAALQDRLAESILTTLIEQGPRALATPQDLAVRAELMWCGTMALNHLIGSGVTQDWATHMIGHELTAEYGLDHAQTLAIVLPGVLRHDLVRRAPKLQQYLARVHGVTIADPQAAAHDAIARTEAFFRQVGVKTRLADYGIDATAAAQCIAARLPDARLGPAQDIGPQQVAEILRQR